MHDIDCLRSAGVDYMTIIFENCEQIKFSAEHIRRLSVGQINCCEDGYYSAEDLELVISPDAKACYSPLEYIKDLTNFDRILFRSDIVSVDIHKSTGDSLELYVYYQEDEKGFNAAEKAYIGKAGELHIDIKKQII